MPGFTFVSTRSVSDEDEVKSILRRFAMVSDEENARADAGINAGVKETRRDRPAANKLNCVS